MGWTVSGFNPKRGMKFFSSPKCPDQLWGPTYPFLKTTGVLSRG